MTLYRPGSQNISKETITYNQDIEDKYSALTSRQRELRLELERSTANCIKSRESLVSWLHQDRSIRNK
jgi:hypothetical protein